jgi:hypothetical protein
MDQIGLSSYELSNFDFKTNRIRIGFDEINLYI